MRRTVSRECVEAVLSKGLEAGGAMRRSLLTWYWDCSGGCLAPVTIELIGREPKWRATHRGRTPPRIFLDMDVPCRKCEPCRKRRATTWAAKAHAEIESSYRTWFVTLTMNHQTRATTRARAQQIAHEDALEFEALSDVDQFRLWVKAAYPHFQRYLKRLRKEAGPLRYLFVAEAHKDGSPHFHVLVHEPDPSENVKEKMLRSHWRNNGLGYAEAKLADTFSAWYCTKYLTKDVHDKVRASFKYGEIEPKFDLTS